MLKKLVNMPASSSGKIPDLHLKKPIKTFKMKKNLKKNVHKRKEVFSEPRDVERRCWPLVSEARIIIP